MDNNPVNKYKHNQVEEYRVGDNQIRAIFEDRYGTLWIGTNTAGIFKFDRKKHIP